jgi:hypothetical protein
MAVLEQLAGVPTGYRSVYIKYTYNCETGLKTPRRTKVSTVQVTVLDHYTVYPSI